MSIHPMSVVLWLSGAPMREGGTRGWVGAYLELGDRGLGMGALQALRHMAREPR